MSWIFAAVFSAASGFAGPGTCDPIKVDLCRNKVGYYIGGIFYLQTDLAKGLRACQMRMTHPDSSFGDPLGEAPSAPLGGSTFGLPGLGPDCVSCSKGLADADSDSGQGRSPASSKKHRKASSRGASSKASDLWSSLDAAPAKTAPSAAPSAPAPSAPAPSAPETQAAPASVTAEVCSPGGAESVDFSGGGGGASPPAIVAPADSGPVAPRK